MKRNCKRNKTVRNDEVKGKGTIGFSFEHERRDQCSRVYVCVCARVCDRKSNQLLLPFVLSPAVMLGTVLIARKANRSRSAFPAKYRPMPRIQRFWVEARYISMHRYSTLVSGGHGFCISALLTATTVQPRKCSSAPRLRWRPRFSSLP